MSSFWDSFGEHYVSKYTCFYFLVAHEVDMEMAINSETSSSPSVRGTSTSYLCPALGTLLEGRHDLIVCTCFPVTYAVPLHVLTSLICPGFALFKGYFVGSHYMYLSCPCMSVSWAFLPSFCWERSGFTVGRTVWRRSPCVTDLHAHLAQLSDPRSSRRDSAHAVC